MTNPEVIYQNWTQLNLLSALERTLLFCFPGKTFLLSGLAENLLFSPIPERIPSTPHLEENSFTGLDWKNPFYSLSGRKLSHLPSRREPLFAVRRELVYSAFRTNLTWQLTKKWPFPVFYFFNTMYEYEVIVSWVILRGITLSQWMMSGSFSRLKESFIMVSFIINFYLVAKNTIFQKTT